MDKKIKKRIKSTLFVLGLLLGWGWVVQQGWYSPYLLPSPYQVYESFMALIQDGQLLKHTIVSLIRVFQGYGIALVVAFLLSLLSLLKESWMDYLDGFIQFMRSVPPLSLITLLILWLGIGESSKLMIIFLASFFPMYLGFEKGLKNIDPKLLEVGEAFGFSRFKMITRIILPAARYDLFVAMRIGLGYSYRAIIGAELIAASSGLGYLINFAKTMSQTDVVIVGILVIGLLGWLSDCVFRWITLKWAGGSTHEA